MRGTLRKKKPVEVAVTNHNLHMSLREFGYPTVEEGELQFSLYDAKRSRFVRWADPALNWCRVAS